MIKQLAVVALALMAGCTPGYIKSSELEQKGQGPSACTKSCEDLGMRMTAMVLMGDQIPGCVCQPVVKQGPLLGPEAAPAPAPASAPEPGAAASTTGYVVIAAAAAAQQQRQQQQQQQQQKH